MKPRRRHSVSALTLCVVLLAAGCATVPAPLAPARQPTNFRGTEIWPATVRRVAVFPAHDSAGGLPADFLASHDESWRRALAGSLRAEFIGVPRATLQQLSGRPTLDSTSPLPPALLKRIGELTGAEAVLFLDLVHAKPYPPLSLALRSRLVMIEGAETWWMIDELFDADDPGAARSLREDPRARTKNPGDTSIAALQSPSRFADHAFRAMANVLPPRQAENQPADPKNATPTKFPAKKHPPRADTIDR